MTDKLDGKAVLAELVAGLEGVTPGPWKSGDEDGYGATHLWSNAPKRIDEYGQAGKVIADFWGDNAEACELTPQHIARCHPEASHD
jgi:hypothetical protein